MYAHKYIVVLVFRSLQLQASKALNLIYFITSMRPHLYSLNYKVKKAIKLSSLTLLICCIQFGVECTLTKALTLCCRKQ